MVAIENPVADELSPAATTDKTSATYGITVAPDRGANGRFLPGNQAGKAKRVRPNKGGQLRATKAPKELQNCLNWGRSYAAARRRELTDTHGMQVSVGVGALLETAGLMLAQSRYLAWMVANSGSKDMKEVGEAMKRSASLSTESRQHELAAFELAAREARASKPQRTAHEQLMEALVTTGEEVKE